MAQHGLIYALVARCSIDIFRCLSLICHRFLKHLRVFESQNGQISSKLFELCATIGNHAFLLVNWLSEKGRETLPRHCCTTWLDRAETHDIIRSLAISGFHKVIGSLVCRLLRHIYLLYIGSWLLEWLCLNTRKNIILSSVHLLFEVFVCSCFH